MNVSRPLRPPPQGLWGWRLYVRPTPLSTFGGGSERMGRRT
nr:MAG TPA_asm: hypothetical protein [Caudoviricetes sp.]